MLSVNIFVEGQTDKEFVEAFWNFHYAEKDFPRVTILRGDHARLAEHADRLMEGKFNLIILDADVNTEEGVRAILEPMIAEEQIAGRELNYQCFFVKNNLEDLIRSICPDEKSEIWKCIDQYAACSLASGGEGLRKVGGKSKVYIYVNSHDVPDNFKGKAFSNKNLWDFNHKNLDELLHFFQDAIS